MDTEQIVQLIMAAPMILLVVIFGLWGCGYVGITAYKHLKYLWRTL